MKTMLQCFCLALGLLPYTAFAWSDTWSNSEKDPNTYPWGENPNNGYRMYWKDSPNVLSSLEEFEELYIKVHGCVWSEYGLGVSYDDDGGNHDGDEQWYLTRARPFRANTAFSLYGVLKGTINPGFNCRKGTYINTFFTLEGADTVLQAFKSKVQTAFPDESYGSAFCYQAGINYNYYYQKSGGGSGDDDDSYTESYTMGCTRGGNFEVATFEGSSCDGNNYLNSTSSLGSYNRAQHGLSCAQVWNYGKAMNEYYDTNAEYYDDDQSNSGDNAYYNDASVSYGSIVETLLASSFSCDITMYPNGVCPDPYGLKAKYNRNIIASARRGVATRLFDWRSPMIVLSWLFLLIGSGLTSFSYFSLRRQNVAAKGGGFKGWMNQVWSDISKVLCEESKDRPANSTGKKVKKKRMNERESFDSRLKNVSPGRNLNRETSNNPGRKFRKQRSDRSALKEGAGKREKVRTSR